MKKKISKKDLDAATKHPAETQAAEQASFSPWSTDTLSADVLDEMDELTLPPIVKIADMPLQASLDFTLEKVVASRDEKIDNPLLVAKLTANGNKVTIPCVASIANTLLPGFDKKKDRDEPQEKCPYVGRHIIIRKSSIKESNKWTTEDGKKRKFPTFDVYVK